MATAFCKSDTVYEPVFSPSRLCRTFPTVSEAIVSKAGCPLLPVFEFKSLPSPVSTEPQSRDLAEPGLPWQLSASRIRGAPRCQDSAIPESRGWSLHFGPQVKRDFAIFHVPQG